MALPDFTTQVATEYKTNIDQSIADIYAGSLTYATLTVDNLNLNGNTISSTNTDGNINLNPDGSGKVVTAKVDINGGSIDGTAIGAAAASTGVFNQVEVDDLRLDGNTLSSLDSKDLTLKTASGDIKLLDSNEVGTLVLKDTMLFEPTPTIGAVDIALSGTTWVSSITLKKGACILYISAQSNDFPAAVIAITRASYDLNGDIDYLSRRVGYNSSVNIEARFGSSNNIEIRKTDDSFDGTYTAMGIGLQGRI